MSIESIEKRLEAQSIGLWKGPADWDLVHAPTDLRLLLDVAKAAKTVAENVRGTTRDSMTIDFAMFPLHDALDALEASD